VDWELVVDELLVFVVCWNSVDVRLRVGTGWLPPADMVELCPPAALSLSTSTADEVACADLWYGTLQHVTKNKICAQKLKLPKAAALSGRSRLHCRREARWRPLSNDNIKPGLRHANGSEKLIVDPHPDPDQHQNLATSISVTPCPCLPCLVDIRNGVRKLSCSQRERATDKQQRSHDSALAE